jgi:hypothetical protein
MIELEQRYLEEALATLTRPQSESHLQILTALFSRPNPDIVGFTFDTDVAVNAQCMMTGENLAGKSRAGLDAGIPSLTMELIQALGEIQTIHMASLRSLTMSASSTLAATKSLKRSRNAGHLGKLGKGVLKRSTQWAAGILAMRAATAAAVTGSLDGVHGADPIVVERICERAKSIFQSHGAVHLRSPLLRPRSNAQRKGAHLGGPADLINDGGAVLILPEDLTAPFGK